MNRSILIVICDFLLVSLLAFSTVDIGKSPEERPPESAAANETAPRQDLGNVMRLALQEERRFRDSLAGEVSQARMAAERQASQLIERDKELLSERQRRLEMASELNRAQADANNERKARLEMVSLAEQRLTTLESERKSREQLGAQLDQSRQEAERQLALAAQLDKQMRAAAQETQAKDLLIQQAAQQQAAWQQQSAAAAEQSARLQNEIKREREEKARLARDLEALAANAVPPGKDLRNPRPLSIEFFDGLAANRVVAQLNFARSKKSAANSARSRQVQSILATDGKTTCALCLVGDTPLSFSKPGVDWDIMDGSLARGAVTTPARLFSFHAADPRLVILPIAEADARALGAIIYRTTAEPSKFSDAIVACLRDGSYGAGKFQIDLATPGYVRLEPNTFMALSGQLAPGAGDLVFSREGELLGIMVNGAYCMVLRNFRTTATFKLGTAARQRTGRALENLNAFVAQLPYNVR